MAHSEALTATLRRSAGRESLVLPQITVKFAPARGPVLEHPLELGSLTIGSGPECDWVLSEKGVSRTHVRLQWVGASVVLEDLGSKNGTFVQGLKVHELVLPPNVRAQVGEGALWLESSGETRELPLSVEPRFGDALGGSVPMRAMFAQLKRAASGDQPLLLLGESGTGKEVLARAVHAESPRKDKPLVVLDCAAIAPTLIEAHLFGYTKGAFTGADAAHVGLLAQADGGTLFIDEIGELPLDLQPRLLRALETRQVRPVGDDTWRSADARIIAATHRDLRARVTSREFREDLFYRLSVVEITVPPLREHVEDIPMLVEHFLSQLQPKRTLDDLPPHALELLAAHRWPGNLRELRNTVTRLSLFPELGKEALAALGGELGMAMLPLRDAREQLLAEFERRYVTEALARHAGNVSRAAETLGVSRQFLHRLISRHDVRSRER